MSKVSGVLRMLTDKRGTKHLGNIEYYLYLAIEDIDHTRTKVKLPQTKVAFERFH